MFALARFQMPEAARFLAFWPAVLVLAGTARLIGPIRGIGSDGDHAATRADRGSPGMDTTGDRP